MIMMDCNKQVKNQVLKKKKEKKPTPPTKKSDWTGEKKKPLSFNFIP